MQAKFDKILEQVMELAAQGLPAPSCFEGPVLLAVSGGVDSISMAELFLHSVHQLPFALAHCNFSLRGEESDSDEALVTAWAEKHHIRLFKVRFDTVAYARENACSIEMAARDLRYGWFAEICRANGFVSVAVAHNANDNAETLFLNVLRGTGVRGLAGMAPVTLLPSDRSIVLLRPLLTFTRKQIEGYARANGIVWHEDRSNAEVEYKRNRIRNQVFPLFEKINPSFLRTVNQEMTWFSEAEDILSDWFGSRKDSFFRLMGEDKAELDVETLLGQAHWHYLLFRALEPYGFNASVLSSLGELLESGRTFSGKTFLSPTHRLVTAAGKIILEPLEQLEEEQRPVEITGPGIYSFCGREYEVSLVHRTEDFSLKQPEGTLIFDAAALPFPFWLRRWEQGDWFVPFGMKGRKKISDFFTDRKFTAEMKRKLPMVVQRIGDSHILAVGDMRPDSAKAVKAETSEILMMRGL